MRSKEDPVIAEIAAEMGLDGDFVNAEIAAEMKIRTLFSVIEDAVAMHGFKVMDGDDESVIVRSSELDMDFEISIKQLAG